MCLLICIFVCWLCVRVRQCVCLLVFLPVCVSVCQSIHASTCIRISRLSISSSVCHSYYRPSVYLPVCYCDTMYVCIFVYLSVCFSSKYAQSDLFSNCNCSMSYVKMTFVVRKKEMIFNIITYFKLECV